MRTLGLVFMTIFMGCSGGPDPKDTVFAFIEAVMTSDSLGVVNNLDVDTYVKFRMAEISPQDTAAAIAENRAKTIQSLLGDGTTRSRWMSQQILVNEASVSDSIAEVEVSFIDLTTRHQLYTKMQLKRQPDNSWKIIYFR